MRPSLVIFVAFIFSSSAGSTLVNRTIDDSDLNEIRYIPSTKWQLDLGSSTCSECLLPDIHLTFQQTLHYGSHTTSRSNFRDERLPKKEHGDGGTSRGHDNHSEHDKEDNVETINTPGFPDATVMASLNFTGSAFYVYCVLPAQNDNPSILSTTNLTFLLDDRRVGSFIHDPREGRGSKTDFQYQVPVFFMENLLQAHHTLDIKAEPGSVVLLDYIEYSTLDANASTGGAATSTPSKTLNQSNGSGSRRAGEENKKNKLTFGVAIGCTVGVLTLVALGVFISLYRRRRRSARLQRHFEVEDMTRTADQIIHGPEPFIPRYFPGTVLRPSDHPPALSSLGDDAVEEQGPSHGLDFPPAPEHTEAPDYSTPLIFLGHTLHRTAVRRLSSPSVLVDSHDVPPRYQDNERSLLVSTPVTYPPSPPLPPPSLSYQYSPMLPHSTSAEDFPALIVNVHDISRQASNDAPHDSSSLPNEPPIQTDNDERRR